jgi:asparagine synthase (glutamine-hydrolysing)
VGRDGFEEKRYWTLPPPDPAPPAEEDVQKRLRTLLEESVRMRLVAAVPVGVLLSGGVDSSLVTALMVRHHDGPVRSFTIGFDEEGFDESAEARRVSAALGTDHHEERVRLDAVALLPRVARAFDEPFADTTALPQLVLSEMTRRHVTVALSGDGGDELFAGYRRYRRLWNLMRLRSLPAPLARAGGAVLGWLTRARGDGELKGRIAHALAGGEAEAYLPGVSLLLPSRLRGVAAGKMARLWPPGFGDEVMARWGEGGRAGLQAAMAFDISGYLVDDILAKVDRTSMACSLEVRVPLLDHRVVELASSIPAHYHFGGGRGKRLLQAIARDVLPAEVLTRPKHGFTVPVDRWFRSELKEIARERFADSGSLASEVLSRGWCLGLLEEHAAGRARQGELLWALLMLEFWREQDTSG